MNKINKILNNSILITGSTRTSTTFLGRTLSLAKNTIYLEEPFRVGLKEKNENGIFDYWFEYLPENSKKTTQVLNFIYSYSKLNSTYIKNLKNRNFNKAKFELNQIYRKLKLHFSITHYRLIIKDPIAFYSAEWLYKNINNLKVIVTIRNPISIIESYKKLNWDIGFIEFQRQNKLLQTFPEKYRYLVKEYTINHEKTDIVDKGILYWNLIHYQLLEYLKKYKNDWLFIRFEDLNDNKIDVLKRIFDYCDVPFDKAIKKSLIRKENSWFRNASPTRIKNGILKSEEIEKIRINTSEISKKIYILLKN